jgi:hypothetical protein
MKSELRFRLVVSAAALAMSMLAGYAASETAPHALASPESFASITDTEARSAATSALHQLPSGQRSSAAR